MALTSEMLARFVGGQMEVQNPIEGYLYRGEIAQVDVKGRSLVVKFSWFAKGEGYPPFPEKWVKNEILDYAASLEIYHVVDSDPKRICLQSHITNEIVVLFTPDGSKLDPKKVVGLELTVQGS